MSGHFSDRIASVDNVYRVVRWQASPFANDPAKPSEGAARAGPARDPEDAATDRRSAKAMPRRRHGRPGRPAVRHRVVGLDLIEGPRWSFPPDDEDLPVEHRRGDPAAGGRQRGTSSPA